MLGQSSTALGVEQLFRFALHLIQREAVSVTDGQVLLQGEESFGSIFLTAPEDQFDLETVALWLSGSQLE